MHDRHLRAPDIDLGRHVAHSHLSDRRAPDRSERGDEHGDRVEHVHAQLLHDSIERMHDTLRRAIAPPPKEWTGHFVIDTGTLAIGVGNPVRLDVPRELTVRGVFLENLSTSACRIGVWLGHTIDAGPPYFDVLNGAYKGYPVSDFENVKAVSIALVSGAGTSGKFARILLTSYRFNPRQGTAL